MKLSWYGVIGEGVCEVMSFRATVVILLVISSIAIRGSGPPLTHVFFSRFYV